MTPVEFTPGTGQLRLDRDTFQRMVDWQSGASGASGPPGDTQADALRAELGTAGAVDDQGELHPALAFGFDAVVNPICRLGARIRDGHGRAERAEGWLSAGAAALLLDLPDGRCEFGALLPTFVPVMLVRVVKLGPRPRLDAEPVPATPELLERLTDPDPARRGAATGELGVDSLRELRRDWRIQASWHAADGGPGVRALRVLDTPAGLWLVEPHRDRAVLFPTTPTAVWRALVGLLPTDAELPLG